MFRQMTIALRAGLGFGVVALLVFLLGGFALLQISSMQKEAREVNVRWLPSIVSLGEVNGRRGGHDGHSNKPLSSRKGGQSSIF